MDAHQMLIGAEFDWRTESAKSPTAKVEWGDLYLCGLVGPKFEMAMIKKSSGSKLLAAGLLAGTPQDQRRIICGPIFDSPDGLCILYRMLIEFCKMEICMYFNLVLSEAQWPIVYFCNHGKDRTGLMTAFIQTICGVDQSTVFHNYFLSEYFLASIQQLVDFEMADGGLTPDIMSRTPLFAIQSAFDYLDSEYGGVSAYLAHIGFSLEKQAKLRNRLVEWDQPTGTQQSPATSSS